MYGDSHVILWVKPMSFAHDVAYKSSASDSKNTCICWQELVSGAAFQTKLRNCASFWIGKSSKVEGDLKRKVGRASKLWKVSFSCMFYNHLSLRLVLRLASTRLNGPQGLLFSLVFTWIGRWGPASMGLNDCNFLRLLWSIGHWGPASIAVEANFFIVFCVHRALRPRLNEPQGMVWRSVHTRTALYK